MRPDVEELQLRVDKAKGRGWFAIASDIEIESLCAHIRHIEGILRRYVEGAEAGVNPGYLSRVERNMNKPSLSKLEAICRALGVSPWKVMQTSDLFTRQISPALKDVLGKFGFKITVTDQE